MTRSFVPQYSMSSGEISPLLHARPDFQRSQTGLRTCRGYIPQRQGGASRAPGTIFRGYTKDNAKARLVDFEFAANDALTLEFTPGIMRVWRYGALVMDGSDPYELVIPYADDAAIARLQWAQSADVIYLVDGVLPIKKLSRFALDNWSIADFEIENGPFKIQNLDEALTIQCSAAEGTITLTGAGNIFEADHVGSLFMLTPADYSSIPLWTGNTDVTVGQKMRYGENIYELIEGGTTGVNPPIHISGDEFYELDAKDSNSATSNVKWRFLSDGTGILRITAVTDANTATAEVIKAIPSPCVDAATYRWSEGAWSTREGHPAAIEIDDQRLFAAATPNQPRRVWWSAVGGFDHFEPGTEADEAGGYTISGTDSQNEILWLRRGRKGLYIGALGEVFRAFSTDSNVVIGPTTFKAEVEATDGTISAQPIVAYGYPILITKDQARILELRYNFEDDGGRPLELSLPAQHLGGDGFEDILWQSSPQRQAWLRRSTGDLVVMIYDPDQDVLGWAVVPVAGGVVESLSVTTAATKGHDLLTMVIRREINATTVRMVEEQALNFGVLAGVVPIREAVHLFAAAIFQDPNPFDSVDVPWLEGEDVWAWTDAGSIGPLTVGGAGALSLGQEVTYAVVGLFDDTHEFETLDIQAPAPDGGSMGRRKRIHDGAGLKLHQTSGGFVQSVERTLGEDPLIGDKHRLIDAEVATDVNDAYSGTTSIGVTSGFASEVSLRFTPDGGAPMTVTAHNVPVEEEGA